MAVISTALAQPAASSQAALRQVPMIERLLAKCSSGNMAKGSCRASTT